MAQKLSEKFLFSGLNRRRESIDFVASLLNSLSEGSKIKNALTDSGPYFSYTQLGKFLPWMQSRGLVLETKGEFSITAYGRTFLDHYLAMFRITGGESD